MMRPPTMICSPDVVTSGQQAPTVIDAYYLVGFLAERFRVVFTGARAARDDADGVGFFLRLFSGGGITFISYGVTQSFPANRAACSSVSSTMSPGSHALPKARNGWVVLYFI